ncbi:MAG: Ig-like domain-containing protein [Chitinophagales bacterium]
MHYFSLNKNAFLNSLYKLAILFYITTSFFFLLQDANAQNLPPFAPDTLATCTEPLSPLTLCDSFSDPNNDNVAVVSGHTTFNCSLVFLNDSCVRYTPLPGFVGTDTVFLEICDDQMPAACSQSVTIVHVGCLAPVSENDMVVLSSTYMTVNQSISNVFEPYENGINVDVTKNDNIVCGTNFVVPIITSPPNNGTYSIISATEIHYQPNADFVGLDSLTYVSCNNCPLCDTAQMVINVLPPDFGCNTDIYKCVGPFTTTNICPQFCTLDFDEITQYTYEAEHGTIDSPINNCSFYIPNSNFIGIDIVTFTACDETGYCETTKAYVTIEANCGDNMPVATDDFAETTANVPVVIQVLNNDYDIDGQNLLVIQTSPPNDGVIDIDPNYQTVIYTANIGFIGIDSFTYTICDPTQQCVTASVVVEVLDIEICNETAAYCVAQFTPLNICVEFCDLQNENSVSITDAHTTFECSLNMLNDTCLQFTPLPAFLGTDVITIIGCDADNLCDTTLVTVHVGCVAPQAHDDNAVTQSGQYVELNVLQNDVAPCEDSELSINIFTPPNNGSILIATNQTVVYTPSNDFVGTEIIEYQVCNDCSDTACDYANIIVEVLGVNEIIVANNDLITTSINSEILSNVLSNDEYTSAISDININLFADAENGNVFFDLEGNAIYYPDNDFQGIDYFTYEICYGNTELCDMALVTVVVGNGNNIPVANSDIAYVLENETTSISVLINDTDVNHENSELNVANIATFPDFGTADISENDIIYTPNENFIGTDSLQYIVCDPLFACDTTTLMLHIIVAPNAQTDIFVTSENEPLSFNILANDIGENLSLVFLEESDFGTIEYNENGNINYTPNANFVGEDYFTYQICNDIGFCDEGLVNITVISVGENLNLAANNDSYEIELNEQLILELLDNDIFDETENVSIESYTQGNNGTVLMIDSELAYLPNPSFVGNDEFTYVLCYESFADICDTAIVYIYIDTPLDTNLPPNAITDFVVTDINTSTTYDILQNDNDPNGDTYSIAEFVQPLYGTASINQTGILNYTPFADFSGEDYLVYTICDNGFPILCDTASVVITVASLMSNTPDIYAEIYEDNDTIFCLQDHFGTNLAINNIEIYNVPNHGSPYFIPFNASCIAYSPNLNFSGFDALTIGLCEEQTGFCDTIEILLHILPLNDAPIAINDIDSTNINTSVVIDVLANDYDVESDEVFIFSVENPNYGSLTISFEGIVYTPNENFVGIDTFQYTIADNQGFTNVGTVIVIIKAEDDEQIAIAETPLVIAEDDYISAFNNETINVFPLENDIISDTQATVLYILPNDSEQLTTNIVDNRIEIIATNNDIVGEITLTYSICIENICDEADIIINFLAIPPLCDIHIANAFSPNEDGINDTFQIENVDCEANTNTQITIFNRWGNTVYENLQYKNETAWNGNLQYSNEPVSDGTYFYVIKIDNKHQQQQFTGFLEVRR